jgi:tripartite-type tricarboxylate transporter receptor subunit TctC
MRTKALLLASVLAASGLASHSVQAQTPAYPARLIKMIVPFPPGGGFDGIARPFAEKLHSILGQPVVLENRPGAGGNIGAEYVARSTPDGYTLLFANAFLVTNPPIQKAPGYDPVKDFVAISRVGSVSTALAVHPSVPAKDLKELIELSKKKPLNFGTPGIGTAPHLVGEMMNLNGTMRLVHVPYKGSGPAIADAIGGQIDMVMTPASNVAQHIRAGKLRGIAVLSRNRASIMPDLPTFAEHGLPDVHAETWYGVFAPAGTPALVLKRLNEASVQALAQADLLERLRKAGYEPGSSTPEALAATVKTDLEKWTRVAREAKIQAD